MRSLKDQEFGGTKSQLLRHARIRSQMDVGVQQADAINLQDGVLNVFMMSRCLYYLYEYVCY